MSIRELIFREMVANLLMHREFSSAYPATMTIYKDVGGYRELEQTLYDGAYLVGKSETASQ